MPTSARIRRDLHRRFSRFVYDKRTTRKVVVNTAVAELPLDLERLRELFEQHDDHIAIGKVAGRDHAGVRRSFELNDESKERLRKIEGAYVAADRERYVQQNVLALALHLYLLDNTE